MLLIPADFEGLLLIHAGTPLLRQFQSVPNPRFCEQILGGTRGWFNFFPQAVHEHAQIFLFASVVGTPHCLQEFPVRNCLVRMCGKVRDQIEFLRCQILRASKSISTSPNLSNLSPVPVGKPVRLRTARIRASNSDMLNGFVK
jgi:hypothetical protein